MRLLIAGWQGQVARALVELAPSAPEVESFAVGRPGLDLCNAATITRAMTDFRPDVIINSAAYTAVDKAESEAPAAFALILYLVGGLPWLVWGFCLATTTLAHATFAINTVNHLFGTRRFDTIDESRNNVVTAFFAVGEGWHNNHHRFQRAARNGFYWWEFDPTWYVIRAMAALGLAWNVQAVPPRIYKEARLTRARRPAVPSVVRPVEHPPLTFELAEDEGL